MEDRTLNNGTRWFRWGVPALSLAILAMLGTCLWWAAVDRSPPATIERGEVTDWRREENGNYVLFVRWHGTRHRSCPAVSRRWLVDGAVIPLPDIPYPPADGEEPPGPVHWDVAVVVPAYLVAHGHRRYGYRIRIDYSCNPLQEVMLPIRVAPPSVPFEILPDGTIRAGNRSGGPP